MVDYYSNYTPSIPKSNGLAEKTVQMVKLLMKQFHEMGEDIYVVLLDLKKALSNTWKLNHQLRDSWAGKPGPRYQHQENSWSQQANIVKPYQFVQRSCRTTETERSFIRGSEALPDLKEGNSIRVHTPGGWKPAEYARQHKTPSFHVIKARGQGRQYRRNRRAIMNTPEEPHTIKPSGQCPHLTILRHSD